MICIARVLHYYFDFPIGNFDYSNNITRMYNNICVSRQTDMILHNIITICNA